MEPEISYLGVFPICVEIFSFSSWLELNKNALKSRFLLWWANLKRNFLGDEGGGQALGNLKEWKKWKIVKIVKIAKNEKMKKCKKCHFFDFWQKWIRLIFAFSIEINRFDEIVFLIELSILYELSLIQIVYWFDSLYELFNWTSQSNIFHPSSVCFPIGD